MRWLLVIMLLCAAGAGAYYHRSGVFLKQGGAVLDRSVSGVVDTLNGFLEKHGLRLVRDDGRDSSGGSSTREESGRDTSVNVSANAAGSADVYSEKEVYAKGAPDNAAEQKDRESRETDDRSEPSEPELTARNEDDAFSLFGLPMEETSGLSGFAYDQLDSSVQSVYAQLFTGISEERSKFSLRAPGTEAIKEALSAVILDHPEFFWIDGDASMSGFSALGIWQIELEFNVAPEEIGSIRSVIEDKVAEYLYSLPEDASDYEKVKMAYEYVIRTTDYVSDSPQNQNIQSVFLNGLSVCAGYSKAVQYLLQRAGVWCAYIEGTTGVEEEGHAWNLVRIDGSYSFVDPSWGDPTYGEDSTDASHLSIIYDYLCLTTDEMVRTRHIASDQYELPVCTDKTNDYYVRNGMYYEGFDPDRISAALWHAVDEGESIVYFKFSDENSYQMARNALFPPEGSEAESLLDAPIRQRMEWDDTESMRYYYSCSDDLWIIKVYW